MPEKPSRREFLKVLAVLPFVANVHSFTPRDIELAQMFVGAEKEPPEPRILEVLKPDPRTRIIGVVHSLIPGDPAEEGLWVDVREELGKFEKEVGERPWLVLEYFPVYGTQLLKEYRGWMEPGLSVLTQKRVQVPGLLGFLGLSLGKEVLKEELSRRKLLSRVYDLLMGAGLWTALQATHIPYPSVHTWREIRFARKIDEFREKGPTVGVFGAFHTRNVLRYLKDPLYRKVLDSLYSWLEP